MALHVWKEPLSFDSVGASRSSSCCAVPSACALTPWPQDTFGRPRFRAPPRRPEIVDKGCNIGRRTTHASSTTAIRPNKNICLATSWSASGPDGPMSKTCLLDTHELIGCGMPHIFCKPHTWNELKWAQFALFNLSVSKP